MSQIVALGFRRPRGRPLGIKNAKGMATPVDHRARGTAAWRSLCVAFGDRVRSLREERDISAAGLASAIGAACATIWSWERGERFPSVPILLMVASVLDCSIVDLMPPEAHYRVYPILGRAA